MNIIQKIFGTHSQNELKRVYPIADAVMALDEDMQRLSDEELKAKTKEFKDRLENGETLDDILPEAYAVVKPCVGNEALPRTDHRWNHPASGAYCRDENR